MMIQINNLKKTYRKRLVVDIKKLEIPNKRIFGIVGDNGAGKSTLLKMIADLEAYDEGQINIPVDHHEMVYLFQAPHLFNTSVYNNIAYPLKFRKRPKEEIHEKVMGMINLFNLHHLQDQNALKLSGGECQKVNLARALVFDPKWIFLDEPTANIDSKTTKQIEHILKGLDTSIIIVTHNMSQAERLCDLVAVMSEGKILDVDVPEKALKHKSLMYI